MKEENKSIKEKIFEWLDIKIATIYFYTRNFFEHGIIRWFYELIKKLYNLILSVLLLIFTISFIFFYIRHFLEVSFNNIFINFQLFLQNNFSIYLYLIILIGLIGLKYIVLITKFIFKYFINWTVFWTLLLFSSLILISKEKSFFVSIIFFEVLSISFGILILGLFFKHIFLLDKKDSKKGYYFNFYKKTYDSIFKSKEILKLKEKILKEKKYTENKLKEFENKLENKRKDFYIQFINKLKNGIELSKKEEEKMNLEFNEFRIFYEEFINSKQKIEKNEYKLKKFYFTKYINLIKNFNIKINFIEPISDEPIGIGNDIFGNEDFAKNIYDILNGINFKKFKKSYSIGLVGEWGQGKSSIINLVEEQFLDGNPNFQVLKFNPWDFKKENLVKSFFGELSKLVGIKVLSNSFKSYLNLIGNIDSKLKMGIDFFNGFIDEKSLEEIREEIDKNLKENGRKIVIIIDDLDRCEPDEVLMMLNLIKNLGDFNNIIYLVSYDKQHIIKVLEDKKFSGDYIEKIINIERFIPVPGKEQLKNYFSEKFSEILKNLKKDNTELFDEEKRKEITVFLIKEFDELFEKENLRFIKKLLNQLNIILQLNLEKKDSEVFKLKKEDFESIIIINYVKLKDYKSFNFVIRKIKSCKCNTTYNELEIPTELLNFYNLYLSPKFYKLFGVYSGKIIDKKQFKFDNTNRKDYILNILKNFS